MMDKLLSASELRKKRYKKISGILIIIILIFILLSIFNSVLYPRVHRSRIIISAVEYGPLEGTVSASGLVVPEFEQMITSPFQCRIDSILFKVGDFVPEGEQIMILNNEFMMLQYDRLQDEYLLTQNKQEQLKLQQESTLIDLNTQLQITALKVKANESKLEAQRMIYESGGGAKANFDRAKLELDISHLEYEQLAQRIQNTGKALTADLKELELQLSIQEKKIQELSKQLLLAETRPVRSGYLTWVNDEIGSIINNGEIVAKVSDLERFRVEAKISDIHADKLIIGNPAKIVVNNIELHGSISAIEPTIVNGVMTFLIELEDNQNRILRSNLRVDVYVITSVKDNVLRIENGPGISGRGTQIMFLVRGDKAYARKVELGESNFEFVEIVSGLSDGDEVIVSDMEDHRNRREIKIVNK